MLQTEMRPLVSVIIPVFNTEEYVSQTIRSVLGQTLTPIEIIAVNDGSTDGSLAVLESFGDSVKLISQPNSGQGAARNLALQHAKGEYIYFMDSDDLIDPQTLELCVKRCREDNLDFVFFDATTFGAQYKPDSSPWFDYHRAANYQSVSDGCSVMTDMLSKGIYRCSVCMCLYRADFIRQHSLSFPVGILHEDEYFAAAAYLNATRVAGIDKELYHRRLRGHSVMTTSFSERNVEGYLTTLRLVRGLGGTTQRKSALPLLEKAFITALTCNSWQLPLHVRLRIASVAVFRYPYTLSLRSLCVLLFKKYLR